VRKFIVVDAMNAEPGTVLGLAASTLALGAVYWLVREQDLRQEASEPAEVTTHPTDIRQALSEDE
jgi:hypothetical protein